ncbi:MAG: hypothetical protein ACRDQV_02155 [Pseudonocardiaceae bacterium]
MTAGLALTPAARGIRRLDAAVVALVVIFTGLGQIGHTLGVLAQLPLVGPRIGPVAASVQQTAASTRGNAVEAAASVHVLAVVIGVAIAAVPMAPLLGGYLPLRLARLQQIRDLRRVLAAGPVDPRFIAYLAHGAVARLPYDRLIGTTSDPWGDLVAGRHHELAAAELRRLRIEPPPDWLRGQSSVPRRSQR